MKKLLIAALLSFCLVVFAGCGEKNVAEVNGEAVSYENFESYWDNLTKIYEANNETLDESLKTTVAEQLVYDVLLEQTATELDLLPTDEEAGDYYEEEMALGYGSYENGLAMMEDYGLDEDFFRYQYRCRLYEKKIMDYLAEQEDVSVDEAEAQEIYDADPSLYELRQVSHLLVKPYKADGSDVQTDAGGAVYSDEEWETAKNRCEELIAQLEQGEDFAALTMKYSDDVTTAGNGGRISETLYQDSTGYDAAFLEAAFALTEAGTYTKTPVKTESGYEILYCEQAVTSTHMDDVLAYIRETQEEQNERSLLTSYMKEKEEAAEIVYHRELWE